MQKRKGLKAAARKVLKRHYWLFVTICLVTAFLGIEYSETLDAVNLRWENSAGKTGVASIGIQDNTLTSAYHVLKDIVTGNITKGEQYSEEIKREKMKESENPVLGRTRGVFSQIMNAVQSGSIFITAYKSFHSVAGSRNIATAMLVFLSFMLYLFAYKVVSRRAFLEGRIYDKVPIQRFAFLMRAKRWCRTSWTLFRVFLLKVLWGLTVVGFFIKYYSYFLVPYIVAENPNIKTKDAIRLSKRMMSGHKWECFLLELSFFGWLILNKLTLGIVGIFYYNPYKTAVLCEYYAALREHSKEKGIEGAELLNDRYLFEKPGEKEIRAAYRDILDIVDTPVEIHTELHGFRKFLVEWFGVLFVYSKKEIEYEKQQAERIRKQRWKQDIEGEAYPGRLFTIPEKDKKKNLENILYMRNYSIPSIIMMFFVFSMTGWLWEVCVAFIVEGQFVNRGTLHGPWLPIYGCGAVLILLILKKFRGKPMKEFLLAILLCGFVEYSAASYLEFAHNGKKWWDYSGYFLNLNGKICAEGLLVFGIGGMAIVYLIAPMLDNIFRKIDKKIIIPVCVIFFSIYMCDQVYSIKNPNAGAGITSISVDNPADSSYETQ